jgi:hydroxymethylbilane synthase
MTENNDRELIIGTRGSPLALAQATATKAALEAAHPGLAIAVEIIRTTGDRVQHMPLAEIGGKGLFTKEIEAALLEKRIDLAVHSAKDMETHLPAGLVLAAALPREDPRDVFLSQKADGFAGLPAGAVIGTTSARRRAQILHAFPKLTVVSIRGNVDTRLGKLNDGTVDATLLALAGLKRLGRRLAEASVLEPETMLPAAAQGAIALEAREGDERVLPLLAAINHDETLTRITAERALLASLDGTCKTPIGALAELNGGAMRLRGLVADPDGAWLYRAERSGPARDGAAMGRDAGAELRALAGEDFFGD